MNKIIEQLGPDLASALDNRVYHNVKNVLDHNQPSNKTMEEFGQLKSELRGMKSGCIAHNQENTKMQINVATMNKDIEYIKKKLDDLVDSFQQFAENATSLNGSKADKAELNLFETSTNQKLDALSKKLDDIERNNANRDISFSKTDLLTKIMWSVVGGGVLFLISFIKELLKR